jgi:hypothetical protein
MRTLKKCIQGTRYQGKQIAEKICLMQLIRWYIKDNKNVRRVMQIFETRHSQGKEVRQTQGTVRINGSAFRSADYHRAGQSAGYYCEFVDDNGGLEFLNNRPYREICAV